MSVPAEQLETFLPSELHFLAENETIEILPRRVGDPIKLAGTDLPLMHPLRKHRIPIWMAITLKKQQRCQLIPPDWMEESNLRRILAFEHANPTAFSNVDFHWLEIAQIVLTTAPDDLTSPPQVIRNLVRDIREVREQKSRQGMKEVNENMLQMDRLGALEINEMRPFVVEGMEEMIKIRKAGKKEEPIIYSESDNPEDDEDDEPTYGHDDESLAVNSSQLDSSLRYGNPVDTSERRRDLAQWDDNVQQQGYPEEGYPEQGYQ